jgi:hypothetical protein
MDLDACTLPSAERPLRLAEFDELFATGLLGQSRPEPTRLCWLLDRAAEARARDLTVRESACCEFFTFTFGTGGDGGLTLEVRVPPARVDVLDALAARVARARR